MSERTSGDNATTARVSHLLRLWERAIADLLALARSLPAEQHQLATDLPGWSVQDNVAHTAHLESVLAGGPEDPLAEDAPGASLAGRYTDGGVLARRGRSMEELCAEVEQAAAARIAALAQPPTDLSARPAITPGGVPWTWETLLSNRPLDVWMHEQDIRRAVGKPGGFDSPAAAHTLDVFALGLGVVVGKRVAPPVGTTVQVELPASSRAWTVRVGADGRAVPAAAPGGEPTTSIRLSPEEYVVLSGGRREVDRTSPEITGDAELAAAVLRAMALTP